MSAEITNQVDNYFEAGLDCYMGQGGKALTTTATNGTDTVYDYSDDNDASASDERNACIPVRRNGLGLTYDKGILIPYTLDGTDFLYNFYPRVDITYDDDFKLKFTARIRVIKASYDSTPVSMTVGIGLASGTSDLAAVDNTFLVHSDEEWVDITTIALITKSSTSMTVNCKLGQFDSNPDCLLLCDNWQAEIYDE